MTHLAVGFSLRIKVITYCVAGARKVAMTYVIWRWTVIRIGVQVATEIGRR